MQRWLTRRLLAGAGTGLRGRRSEWAEAMAAEAETLGGAERLHWAAGCFTAGLRLSPAAAGAAYALALACGVAAMAVYQWSADESVLTVALAGALGLGLGLASPRRFLISGVAVGAVVAGVNVFETVTGLRPAYEPAAHSLAHDLRWLVLVAPALFAAAVGRTAAAHLTSQP